MQTPAAHQATTISQTLRHFELYIQNTRFTLVLNIMQRLFTHGSETSTGTERRCAIHLHTNTERLGFLPTRTLVTVNEI